MSQIQFGSAFIANAKSTVIFGRSLTDAETAALNAEKVSLVESGAVFSQTTENVTDPTTLTVVSYWGNITQAQEYIAIINGFTPAVTSASVVAI